MSREPVIVIRVGRRSLIVAGVAIALAVAFLAYPGLLRAQKIQQDFNEKLDIADDMGGVSIAVSADGKYVYAAGPEGVIVSDDFGKTGTWVQTVRLK